MFQIPNHLTIVDKIGGLWTYLPLVGIPVMLLIYRNIRSCMSKSKSNVVRLAWFLGNDGKYYILSTFDITRNMKYHQLYEYDSAHNTLDVIQTDTARQESLVWYGARQPFHPEAVIFEGHILHMSKFVPYQPDGTILFETINDNIVEHILDNYGAYIKRDSVTSHQQSREEFIQMLTSC